MTNNTNNGSSIKRRKSMIQTTKLKKSNKSIKEFGNNTESRMMHIGNKNIKLISYNGNIVLKREKLEINKDNKEKLLRLKRKKKEKNNNNSKNTLNKSNFAHSLQII